MPAHDDYLSTTQRLDNVAGTICECQRPSCLAEFCIGLFKIRFTILSAPDARRLAACLTRSLLRPEFSTPDHSGSACGLWSVTLGLSPQCLQRTAQAGQRTARTMACCWTLLGGAQAFGTSSRDASYGVGSAKARPLSWSSTSQCSRGRSTTCAKAFVYRCPEARGNRVYNDSGTHKLITSTGRSGPIFISGSFDLRCWSSGAT